MTCRRLMHWGRAASQLGPDLQATVVDLNKTVGASHGKTCQVVQSMFGIKLTRGGCAQTILRAGRRLAPVYDSIVHAMPKQAYVSPDETGWRVGGEKAWLHTFAAEDLVCYVIDPKRDASAAKRVLGADYDGVMIHDGWSPYDQFTDAEHQQCLAHLIRRCREMLDVATRGAVRFPRAIKKLLQDALRLRDRRDANEISEHGLLIVIGKLEARLDRLLGGKRSNAPNRRLANHLDKHRDELFTFLRHPGAEATNWRAEQALRPAVVNRKVWGGNRTWSGAKAQSVLMTVLRTCALQGRSVLDYVSECLRCRENPPVLLPASL